MLRRFLKIIIINEASKLIQTIDLVCNNKQSILKCNLTLMFVCLKVLELHLELIL